MLMPRVLRCLLPIFDYAAFTRAMFILPAAAATADIDIVMLRHACLFMAHLFSIIDATPLPFLAPLIHYYYDAIYDTLILPPFFAMLFSSLPSRFSPIVYMHFALIFSATDTFDAYLMPMLDYLFDALLRCHYVYRCLIFHDACHVMPPCSFFHA